MIRALILAVVLAVGIGAPAAAAPKHSTGLGCCEN